MSNALEQNRIGKSEAFKSKARRSGQTPREYRITRCMATYKNVNEYSRFRFQARRGRVLLKEILYNIAEKFGYESVEALKEDLPEKTLVENEVLLPTEEMPDAGYEENPPRDMELAELRGKLEKTLQKLTPRQRQILTERIVNERSFEAIGQNLGIDKQAAHDTWIRAIKNFRYIGSGIPDLANHFFEK